MGFTEMFSAILSAAARAAQRRAKVLGLGGNMAGDKEQNGGCLVVEKGGGNKPLLHYIQQGAPDHVDNFDVLMVTFIEIYIHPIIYYISYSYYMELYCSNKLCCRHLVLMESLLKLHQSHLDYS